MIGRGHSLLLVTDGRFERRDEAVDVSLVSLAGHAMEALSRDGDPQAALTRLVARARPASSEDDATLLLARRL